MPAVACSRVVFIDVTLASGPQCFSGQPGEPGGLEARGLVTVMNRTRAHASPAVDCDFCPLLHFRILLGGSLDGAAGARALCSMAVPLPGTSGVFRGNSENPGGQGFGVGLSPWTLLARARRSRLFASVGVIAQHNTERSPATARFNPRWNSRLELRVFLRGNPETRGPDALGLVSVGDGLVWDRRLTRIVRRYSFILLH